MAFAAFPAQTNASFLPIALSAADFTAPVLPYTETPNKADIMTWLAAQTTVNAGDELVYTSPLGQVITLTVLQESSGDLTVLEPSANPRIYRGANDLADTTVFRPASAPGAGDGTRLFHEFNGELTSYEINSGGGLVEGDFENDAAGGGGGVVEADTLASVLGRGRTTSLDIEYATASAGTINVSPNGTKYKTTVTDDGSLNTDPV